MVSGLVLATCSTQTLELFNFSLVIYVGGCSAFALARQLPMPSPSSIEHSTPNLEPRTLKPPEATARPYTGHILVYRFIDTGTYHRGFSSASNFRHRCTTGATLISVIPLSIRSLNSSQEATRIPRRNVRAIFPNKVSTKFSHDPCVGVCT